jgi:hypothetical protein
VYFDLFIRQLGPALSVIFLLYLLGRGGRQPLDWKVGNWSLGIVSILVFLLYSLVYVEGRYVAVFIVLLWGDLLSNLSLPRGQLYNKLGSAASLLIVLSLLGNLAVQNLEGFNSLVARHAQQVDEQVVPPPTWPGEVAEELLRLGIRHGNRVAVIGYAFDSYWARLARVKIVAEMLDWEADPFWLGDAASQARVIQAFARTGARAIIAEHVPAYAHLDGWRQVGNSNYYIYRIDH